MIKIAYLEEQGLAKTSPAKTSKGLINPPNKSMSYYPQYLQRGGIGCRASAHPKLKVCSSSNHFYFRMPSMLALDNLPLHPLPIPFYNWA